MIKMPQDTHARALLDQYWTPAWAVDRLLEALPLPSGSWLEPCAGDGAIIRAVDARRSGVLWSACEIDPALEPALHAHVPPERLAIGDFLLTPYETRPFPALFDVAFTNPPYVLAEAILRKCQQLAGITVALLRVNFLESAERAAWFREWTPDVYVLPNRPTFTGDGKSYPAAYGWFVWDWRRVSGKGSLQMLGLTPKAERSRKERKPRAKLPVTY